MEPEPEPEPIVPAEVPVPVLPDLEPVVPDLPLAEVPDQPEDFEDVLMQPLDAETPLPIPLPEPEVEVAEQNRELGSMAHAAEEVASAISDAFGGGEVSFETRSGCSAWARAASMPSSASIPSR